MVYLTIDTKPVKGFVTIRERYSGGRILAEGTAPVETYQTGQWIYYVSFGEVEGYTKPSDDGGRVSSDKILTYTYVQISPPPNGNGEPPNGEPPNGEPPTNEELPTRLPLAVVITTGVFALVATVWGISKIFRGGK